MSSSMGHPVNLQRSTLYVSSSEHKWLFPKRFHHLHRRLCSVTPISPSSLLTWELYPFAFNLTISICHVSGSVFFTTFVTMYHHLTLLDLWTLNAWLPLDCELPEFRSHFCLVHCWVLVASPCVFPGMTLSKLCTDVNKTTSYCRMDGKQIPRRPALGRWL